MGCVSCKSQSVPRIVLHSKNIKRNGDIVRCPECKLTFIHPMPADEVIAEYYEGLYEELAAEFDPQKMKWANRSIRGYIEQLDHLGQWPKKSFLDLGGGLGYYSKAAHDKGLDVTLVDLDPISIAFARNKLGLRNVHLKAVDAFALLNDGVKYDLIFMRHVIEHYKKPDETLATVYSLLSDDGAIIIETDNNEGIEIFFKPAPLLFYYKLYNEYYQGQSLFSLIRKRPLALDPPRHLYGFRIENLHRLMIRKGFRPIKSFTYGLGDRIYWPNLPHSTISDIGIDIGRMDFKRAMGNILDYCLIPFRKLLNKMGMSSGICIYATKGNTEN